MEPFIPRRGGHALGAAGTGASPGFLQRTVTRLQSSERCLVELMIAERVWTAPPPDTTGLAATGDLEWSTVLFLLHHKPLIADQTVRLLADAFEALLMLDGVTLPPTILPASQYALLDANKVVAPSDGTLLGTGAYELYDQRWLGAFVNVVRSIVEGRIYNDGKLPVPAVPDPTFVAAPRNARVTLALLSDWGTGTQEAAAVMRTLVATDPDLVVHLGDVYYSGTPVRGPFEPAGEERANLLAPWPAALAGRSFALNSNHEMYSGAQGYFEALGGGATPFTSQRGCSMFAIAIGDWTVLGLDSAFYAAPDDLYLDGSLARADAAQQTAWIASLGLDPARVIVLTHHNAVAADCDAAQQTSSTALWTQLRAALGGDPWAWYWGHIHNGIVYASPLTIGDPTQPVLSTTTHCRCLGHGALPYGLATDLQRVSQVAWQAATPSERGAELLNGFVTLAFDVDASGRVARITEAYHDSGDAAPRYAGTLHAAATAA